MAAPGATLSWSKIAQGAGNPPPVTTQPTKPIEPAAQSSQRKNNVLVMRKDDTSSNASSPSATTTAFSSTPAKKWDWADDEDDILDAQAPPTQRAKELEGTVANKDARIKELEVVLDAKADRIDSLECELDEKMYRINQLEDALQEKQSEVTALEDFTQAQELTIRQYVGEVDEKDRRIAELEQEIEEKAEEIRKLEFQAPEETAQSASFEPLTPSTAVEYPASERAVPEHTPSEYDPSEHTPSKRFSPPVPETKMPELSPEEYPSLSQAASKSAARKAANEPEPAPADAPVVPAPCDSTEPVFATPQTIKQAPPVPPAPVLKMGIDMSKWGKKLAPKADSPGRGFGPKRKVDPTAVPAIDPILDVRKMSRDERELLGNGGRIDVKMGKQSLGQVPKYMLMQCSLIAHKHFTENPKATSITFPEGSMDVEAAKVHIDWMQQHCVVGKVFSISLNHEHTDERNLNIVRAARVLGLNNTYVGHFTRQYCDKIREHDLNYELMGTIATLAYPGNDPIYDCLANNIANQRKRGTVSDPEGLKAFLDLHPTLMHKVEAIEGTKATKKTRGGANRRGPRSSAPHSRSGSTSWRS